LAAAPELTTRLSSFIPADRAAAMAGGRTLPERALGTVLFADLGGFTLLTESMEQSLGAERGAQEVATWMDRIFGSLTEAVDAHHGSIVSSAGDSITCWFDAEHDVSSAACSLEMQEATRVLAEEALAAGLPPPGLKVSLATGEARRFVVGDPEIQVFDVLTGEVADRAGLGEKQCRPGEVMVDAATAEALAEIAVLGERRDGFVLLAGLEAPAARDPWPELAPGAILDPIVMPWVAPPVYERLQAGHARFLSEFRPVVVEFVSFRGIDYEDADAREALDASLRRTQEILGRNGGGVFDVNMGDKGSYLLAVFGAPTTHGDDVRRAATAADELRRHAGSDVRVGVHTGRVYAGLHSGRYRSHYGLSGDVVNLASRLMTAAAPGQVLMSAAVGAALDRRFALAAVDPIPVKGRTAPVPVCVLYGQATASANLSEPRYPLPMVGRQRELEAIDAALAAAARGQGGVLAFCADAGLGKSRLVNATLRRASEQGFTTFAGECQPYGRGIAYLPWQPVCNGLLGLPAGAPDAVRREALQASLAAAAPMMVPLAPLLGTVLDLPLEDNDATRSMPAPARKQLLEQLLAGTLQARAEGGPLCVVLEDFHWADALSRDLLAALAAVIAGLPVLLVLAYRPAADQVAVQAPGAAELRLEELSDTDASELAATFLTHLTEEEADPRTVAAVVDRAEGNPFYVEELVRGIVERGGSTDDLPTSLESLILERIDRLEPREQLAARVASVVGRRFATEWLTGAYAGTLSPSALPAALAGLRESGLIVPDTPPPDEAHLFRHVVVRDVAYGTLGFQVRQELHEQLAAYLEAGGGGDAPPVELIAYHYARSANSAKEAVYRRLAAEVAIRNGAYSDALAHVERATEIVAAQPDGPERLEQELELTLLLGSILLVTDGQGSAKAKAVYDRARELTRTLPPSPAVGRAVFGLWTYYLFQGLMGPTSELADEAVALTERSPDHGVRIMAHLAVAQTHMWTGQWSKCVEHYDRVVELYDPGQHQAYITQYAQNPRFTASNSGFWAEWMLGNVERANAVAEEAIAEARALDHDFTYTIAFLGRPLIAWFRRRDDELLASVGEYVECAQRSGNPFYIALSLSLDGCAKAAAGDVDGGIAQLEEQYATMQALGSKLVDPLMISFLGEAYRDAGRHETALRLIDETMASFERDGRTSFVPDHLRMRAELILARDPGAHDEALNLLTRATETAREHAARSLELRAALSAARVLRALGRDDEARAWVAPAYAGFTEGFDDADLREAREYL
jgi:predicted ATPase/class 3 adenylate cyclase